VILSPKMLCLSKLFTVTFFCSLFLNPYSFAESDKDLSSLVQKRLFLERKISQLKEEIYSSETSKQLHFMEDLMGKYLKQLLSHKVNYIENKIDKVRSLATIKKKVDSTYKELCLRNENLNKCKLRAKNLAIREAIEKGSSVRVVSESEVQEFELVKDIIKLNVEADMIIDNIEYILDNGNDESNYWIVNIAATIVTEPDARFISTAKSKLERNFNSIIYKIEMNALQQILSNSVNFNEVLGRDLKEIKKKRKAGFVSTF